jgi:hypothetical protein
MARMPSAEWIGPTPNETPSGMDDHRGLVLHIQQGTEAGSESWFKNPSAQASAHFLNPKTGGLRQLIDTDDRAWAQMAGNRYWVSVENEGVSGDSLTPSQLENASQLLAWLHTTYGIPLQSTDDPAGQGLGWHGMGGNDWGGHFDCPGDPIKAQRAQIIARAGQILGQPTAAAAPAPAPAPQPATPARYQTTIDGLPYGYGAHGAQVTTVGMALVAHGCGTHYQQGPGPDWSDADTLNYSDWQRSLGYTGSDADGVPGPTSLQRLLGFLPAANPNVSLAAVIDAARTDPGAEQGHQSHPGDVYPVEQALLAEGLLDARWASDGSYGTSTVTAYSAWQQRLGYSGSDADGIPGHTSLTELGQRHGFTTN